MKRVIVLSAVMFACSAVFISAEEGSTNESATALIRKNLERTEVLDVNFEKTPIQDVVKFLSSASVKYGKSGQDQGVGFVLKLDTEGSPEADSKRREIPLISFRASYISLLEVLDVVVDLAGLKYRIENRVVMLVPRDAPDGEIVHRTYDVLPSIGDRMKQIGEDPE